jgi:hypothetical protein
MASSGIFSRGVRVRTHVSGGFCTSIIKVTRIVELGTTTVKVVPSLPIVVTLMMEALSYYETLVLT